MAYESPTSTGDPLAEARKSPFFGAAFDDRSRGATFLLEVPDHPEFDTKELQEGWYNAIDRIEKMGPDAGGQVLRQISHTLEKKGGVSQLEVILYIAAYTPPAGSA